MNLSSLKTFGKAAGSFIRHNSPTILTALAVAGVATTSFLSGKAAVKATDKIRSEEKKKGYKLTKKEAIKLTWKDFIAPVGVGITTAGCIIGSNSLHLRRTAALASMYTIAETTLKEYQNKVVETVGERKEQKIRDEVVKEQLAKSPLSKNEVTLTGNGETLFYESVSGRYFKSDLEKIRKIQNDLVYRTLMQWSFLSLNDFYNSIGLSRIAIGDELGWNNDKPLDIEFTTMLADNGQPCIVIGYTELPRSDFRD